MIISNAIWYHGVCFGFSKEEPRKLNDEKNFLDFSVEKALLDNTERDVNVDSYWQVHVHW